jgi:hypothetical protein
MNKLEQFLLKFLVKVVNALVKVIKKLEASTEQNEQVNLMELGKKAYDERVEPIPSESRFGSLSFDEALDSTDFAIRHGIANKLISAFTYEKEDVSLDLLKKCSTVALERVTHNLEDEKKLIGIWTDQHNTTDFEVYTRLEDEELAFAKELEKKMEEEASKN